MNAKRKKIGLEIALPEMPMWEQVDGDMNPGRYGGTIARCDGSSIELLKFQPTREYVGDGEAADVGFPFWTREACFDLDDLNVDRDEVKSALNCVGLEAETLDALAPQQRAIAIACALLDYGVADEGPAGWAADVIPGEVKWNCGKVAGPEYFVDEDDDFRREVLGEEEEEEEETEETVEG